MDNHLELLKSELEKKSAQIFDVREKDEWNDGHLEKADFVPLSELQAGLEPENKDVTLKTYLYCRSGKRVHIAKPILENMGFTNVVPLQEGFDELAEFGFETEE